MATTRTGTFDKNSLSQLYGIAYDTLYSATPDNPATPSTPLPDPGDLPPISPRPAGTGPDAASLAKSAELKVLADERFQNSMGAKSYGQGLPPADPAAGPDYGGLSPADYARMYGSVNAGPAVAPAVAAGPPRAPQAPLTAAEVAAVRLREGADVAPRTPSPMYGQTPPVGAPDLHALLDALSTARAHTTDPVSQAKLDAQIRALAQSAAGSSRVGAAAQNPGG